jgi:hypothetical protein
MTPPQPPKPLVIRISSNCAAPGDHQFEPPLVGEPAQLGLFEAVQCST